jgi:hypothetical protein
VWQLENTIEEAAAGGDTQGVNGQACAAEVSALLSDTTVVREALAKSTRAFEGAEKYLTVREGQRTRIGNSCIKRVPNGMLPLMRLQFCRSNLELPPLLTIYGSKDPSDQYFVHQSTKERKSGPEKIMPSVESGPGTRQPGYRPLGN